MLSNGRILAQEVSFDKRTLCLRGLGLLLKDQSRPFH